MDARMLIVADKALPFEQFQDCRELARSFANFISAPVEVVFARPEQLLAARIGAEPSPGDDPIEMIVPTPPSLASMFSADFAYLPDGRPNWRAIWESFCDLALYGGPPHRGPNSTLQAPNSWGEPGDADFDAIEELRRGIWETTGLYSEEAEEPGWLVISCRSQAMAVWLAASIILENVAARFEDNRLLVPASKSFRLKDEVKSVITVVTKTYHYWTAHVIAQEAGARV